MATRVRAHACSKHIGEASHDGLRSIGARSVYPPQMYMEPNKRSTKTPARLNRGLIVLHVRLMGGNAAGQNPFRVRRRIAGMGPMNSYRELYGRLSKWGSPCREIMTNQKEKRMDNKMETGITCGLFRGGMSCSVLRSISYLRHPIP